MPGSRLNIRPQAPGDDDGVWAVLEPVVRSGESFVNEPDATREEVLATWLVADGWNFVAELDGRIVAAFYVKANGTGLSGHIANASFAVNPAARGHGVGRAIGEFALGEAKRRGFEAMQFNAVVSTNEGAIALWRSLGFVEVGRIPGAFRLRGGDYVDTLVMHRRL